MKKVKEWKNNGPQFSLAFFGILKRLRDDRLFLMNHRYSAYGKSHGSKFTIIESDEDMIQVFYHEICPDNDSIESGWVDINDIYVISESGETFLTILDKPTIKDPGTAICYSD